MKKMKACTVTMRMQLIVIILLTGILLTSTQAKGQYNKDKGVNIPGIVGISSLPTSFIIAEINYSSFVAKFGEREGYMQGNKLSSYESVMKQNSNIVLTGAIITVAGLVIQAIISNKRNNKKACWR
jgi:hypothetical protein